MELLTVLPLSNREIEELKIERMALKEMLLPFRYSHPFRPYDTWPSYVRKTNDRYNDIMHVLGLHAAGKL